MLRLNYSNNHKIKLCLGIAFLLLGILLTISVFFESNKDIVCYSELDCNDNLSNTIDLCINAKTVDSYCSHGIKQFSTKLVQELDLDEKSTVSVDINNQTHSIHVYEVNGADTTIQIFSEPQTVNVKLGEIASLDLNEDGIDDVQIFIKEINNGRIKIIVKDVNKIKNFKENVSSHLKSENGKIFVEDGTTSFEGALVYTYTQNGTNKSVVVLTNISSNQTFDIFSLEGLENGSYNISISVFSCELLEAQGMSCDNFNASNSSGEIITINTEININETEEDEEDEEPHLGGGGSVGGSPSSSGNGGGGSTGGGDEEPEYRTIEVTSTEFTSHLNSKLKIDDVLGVYLYMEAEPLDIDVDDEYYCRINDKDVWFGDYVLGRVYLLYRVYDGDNDVLPGDLEIDCYFKNSTNGRGHITAFMEDNNISVDANSPRVESFSNLNVNSDVMKSEKYEFQIYYSEEMDVFQTPTIEFSERDFLKSLSNCQHSWITNSIGNYSCDMRLVSLNLPDIYVNISKIQDGFGNPLIIENDINHFSAFTSDPLISNIKVNSITDLNMDEPFNISFTFTDSMNQSSTPMINFTPDLDSIVENCTESWISSDTFSRVCDVKNIITDLGYVNVSINNTENILGNKFNGLFEENLFGINTYTLQIESFSYNLDTIVPNQITDIDRGSDKFEMNVSFSKDMDTRITELLFTPSEDSLNPTLSVSDVITNCSFDWINSKNLSCECDILARGVNLSDVSLTLNNFRAITGEYVDYTDSNTFDIDVNYWEPISFAINYNYTVVHEYGDWKDSADAAIAEMNNIFAKTSRKRYEIKKYVIYNDSDHRLVRHNFDNYVYDEGRPTSLIQQYVQTHLMNTTEVNDLTGGFIQCASLVYFNGVSYPIISLFHSNTSSILHPDMFSMPTLTHEMGHTNGLAYPDQYLYKYTDDCMGVAPILGVYDYNQLYSCDPMTNRDGCPSDEDLEFNNYNSNVIDINLNHRYTYMDVSDLIANTARVWVTDESNNPIDNVQVDVYCIRIPCYYCDTQCRPDGPGTTPIFGGSVNTSVLLETVYTDSNGYAEYTRPANVFCMDESGCSTSSCIAKKLVAHKDALIGAEYTQHIDLEEQYLIDYSDTYTKQVIIS